MNLFMIFLFIYSYKIYYIAQWENVYMIEQIRGEYVTRESK